MTECENLRVGKEFLSRHKWPVALRKTTHDRCYCNQCYLPSQPDTYSVGGYDYVIPRSWTRFGVYVDEPFAKHHNVWKTWANCYHGTSIENAKSIVEHRQLLLPRDMTLDGKKLQIREGHIPGEYYFFTTPTIKYAALDCYAHTYNFTSPTNSKHYKIKVSLQCKQKPDSFTIQPETVGARQRQQTICQHVSNNEMEWKTQHRSAIMPYGLMLQIKNDGNDEDHDDKVNDCNKTKKAQEIKCPHCSQANVWKDGGYKEGAVVTCVYQNCKKDFQQMSCAHCSGSISWKEANYKEGSVVTCPYETCKKKFQQLNCLHCSRSINWKNGTHKDGSVVTCPYENCRKKFQQLACLHCSRSIYWRDANHKEGSVVTCPYEPCKKKFQHLNCMHCSRSIYWKDANHKEESVVTCPYENCKKKFQQLSCPHCSRSIYWGEADHQEGSVVTCPYESCQKKFQQLACPHCSGSIVWKNADHKLGTVSTCPYENCKKTFS
jgi:DNA-directed RNA polymerase subunit RPC12/RpoP